MAAFIPASHRVQFSNVAHLANQIEARILQADARILQCIEPESCDDVLVTGMPADMLDAFDEALIERGIHRSVRLTYEGPLKSLIIRVC